MGNWILSLNAPTMPRSSGNSRITNCSAASFNSSSDAVMLPLVSSMATTENASGSLLNNVRVTGLPLSNTSKSSRPRSGTSRLSASTTVT